MIVRLRTLRRLVALGAIMFLALQLGSLLLPADNTIYLAIHFNIGRLISLYRGSGPQRDTWIWRLGSFPVNPTVDIGLLFKTGYGTRDRVPAQLRAYGLGAKDEDRFVVVGDFAQRANSTDGRPIIHDAIAGLLRTSAVAILSDAPRFQKYQALQRAIQEGYDSRTDSIARSVGWELDAMKFIWGLDLAYKSLSRKKWYIILDDDTYLIMPSLKQFLSHLDPSRPHYLGNAVGDFKGRFGHGGSAIILSSEAVKRLLGRPDIVNHAHTLSLTETWGDRLIATTFQKLGIYIDERFNHFFNGESPIDTRIRADRFCSPLVSFHELKKSEDMERTGRVIENTGTPIRWSQVWTLFDGPALESFYSTPMPKAHDHVGKVDENVKTYHDVDAQEACQKMCLNHGNWCLAWTWDSKSRDCHTSPWMIIGRPSDGKFSGVNARRATQLMSECGR